MVKVCPRKASKSINKENNLTKYYQILFPLPLNETYTYSTTIAGNHLGKRVLVSFRNKREIGIIVAPSGKNEKLKKIKEIIEIIDQKPIVSEDLIKLIFFISSYYLVDKGSSLKTIVPKFYFKKPLKKIVFNNDKKQTLTFEDKSFEQFINYLKDFKIVFEKELKIIFNKDYQKKLTKAKRLNLITVKYEFEDIINDKKEFVLKLAGNFKDLKNKIPPRSVKMIKLFDIFENTTHQIAQRDLVKKHKYSYAQIKEALNIGILTREKQTVFRDPIELGNTDLPDLQKLVLTEQQQNAIEEVEKDILAGKFKAFLLWGITGSGKTMVFLHIAQKILKQKKKVLILIPEISLAGQTVKLFKAFFREEKIALIHSKISDGEKYDTYNRIIDDQYNIIIGARSALFAPIKNIGLIVVDEEHSETYKQDKSPFYDAKNCSVLRAKFNDAIILLASATPTLESFFNVKNEKYKLLKLTKRPTKSKLPRIILREFQEKKYELFIPSTISDINAKIKKGEQVIIFYNRRGYASFLKCSSCNYIETCPHCSVSLTYHFDSKILKCHYCGYSRQAPTYCSNCNNKNIYFRGFGTQKVEEEMIKYFGKNSVIRIDHDTVSKKRSYEELMKKFINKEASILIGTQMISKGLDFPNVTLVVILNADMEINFPDFRADERAFSLLTQVAGRAGRGELNGEVIIQTYDTENELLQMALQNKFASFVKKEFALRKNLNYPPFTKIGLISLKNNSEELCQSEAEKVYDYLIKENKEDFVFIYPPVESLVYKVENIYKINIIVKSLLKQDPAINYIRNLFSNLKTNLKLESKLSINIDPLYLV